MSLHDIFDLIQDKLYRQLASPLSDCINRDSRALGSITEVEMMSFTDNPVSRILTGETGIVIDTGQLSVEKLNVCSLVSSNGSIDCNEVFLTNVQIPDPTSSSSPVSLSFIEQELNPINTQINRINNYLLILSSTYSIKDGNGVAIRF
jgi:hypothetical protein